MNPLLQKEANILSQILIEKELQDWALDRLGGKVKH